MDELLKLCTFLDEQGCFGLLPKYVAGNLDRIPAVKLEDIELFCVSQKLEALEKRLAAVEVVNCKLDHISDKLADQHATVDRTVDKIDSLVANNVPAQSAVHKPSWSDIFTAGNMAGVKVQSGAAVVSDDPSASSAVHGLPFQLVVRKQKKQKQKQRQQGQSTNNVQVHLRGTKESSSGIRAIPWTDFPREGVLSAFVGRLYQDTTEEELTQYLSDEGIRGVVCRKLQDKNGRIFQTAAFRVTCCQESADLFYDEAHWPEGVELRDWVYKR